MPQAIGKREPPVAWQGSVKPSGSLNAYRVISGADPPISMASDQQRPTPIATEIQSVPLRLEQLVRWHRLKEESLPSAGSLAGLAPRAGDSFRRIARRARIRR